MRVGLVLDFRYALESLKHVARSLTAALAQHEVVHLPREYAHSSRAARERIAEEFVRGVDVMVGMMIPDLLSARERAGVDVPGVFFLLGALSRGAFHLQPLVSRLTRRDILVGNCAADAELGARFFTNARMRVVPFSFDEEAFYPLGDAERREARARLGFGDAERIILYSGRVTPEKNLHTSMRIFRTVQRAEPNAHLVIAGPVQGVPFPEFGVVPIGFDDSSRAVQRMAEPLEIPAGNLHLLGAVDPDRLRDLYNVADLTLNMTLHHDENFGLAQVESMACGTPVVASAWGGLRDTVVDGVTGYQVSAVVSETGVRVNGWEAVNKVLAILRDAPLRARLREGCIRRVAGEYTQRAFETRLAECLTATACAPAAPAERIRPTEFAHEIWSVCSPFTDGRSPFGRGRRSYELYRRMMSSFAGMAPQAVPAEEPAAPDHVLCLAAPFEMGDEGYLQISDPLFPFQAEVPKRHDAAVRAIHHVMRAAAVIPVGRLVQSCPEGTPGVVPAIEWMLEVGVLVRTRPTEGWAATGIAGREWSEPLFQIERMDCMRTYFIALDSLIHPA